MIEQIPPIADRMWMPRSAREKQRGFLINPYVAAGPSDPYFSSVVLLMHGQTLLLDSSSYARTVSQTGAVALTSSNPKWGANSLNFTNGRLFVPHSTDFDAGTQDMTCEMWAYFNSTGIGGRCYLCGNNDTAGAHGTYGIYKLTTNVLHGYCFASGGAGVDGGASASAALNTWVHLALSKNGTAVRFFVNGVQQGTAGTLTGAMAASYGTNRFSVGGDGEYVSSTYGGTYGDRMAGQMADFRLTIGVGRYTSNFTPPTAQFPDH